MAFTARPNLDYFDDNLLELIALLDNDIAVPRFDSPGTHEPALPYPAVPLRRASSPPRQSAPSSELTVDIVNDSFDLNYTPLKVVRRLKVEWDPVVPANYHDEHRVQLWCASVYAELKSTIHSMPKLQEFHLNSAMCLHGTLDRNTLRTGDEFGSRWDKEKTIKGISKLFRFGYDDLLNLSAVKLDLYCARCCRGLLKAFLSSRNVLHLCLPGNKLIMDDMFWRYFSTFDKNAQVNAFSKLETLHLGYGFEAFLLLFLQAIAETSSNLRELRLWPVIRFENRTACTPDSNAQFRQNSSSLAQYRIEGRIEYFAGEAHRDSASIVFVDFNRWHNLSQLTEVLRHFPSLETIDLGLTIEADSSHITSFLLSHTHPSEGIARTLRRLIDVPDIVLLDPIPLILDMGPPELRQQWQATYKNARMWPHLQIALIAAQMISTACPNLRRGTFWLPPLIWFARPDGRFYDSDYLEWQVGEQPGEIVSLKRFLRTGQKFNFKRNDLVVESDVLSVAKSVPIHLTPDIQEFLIKTVAAKRSHEIYIGGLRYDSLWERR